MQATSLLAGWDNFYVIVGSAAGGLTGLTFVVIALVRDAGAVRMWGLRTYVTPTIVHFGGVLALAAYLSMPHQNRPALSIGLLLCGAAGSAYSLYTGFNLARRAGADYQPVLEDWLFNVILPTLCYAALAVLGVLVWRHTEGALFGVAAVCLVMLFVGIRNAWDIAVWMTTARKGDSG